MPKCRHTGGYYIAVGIDFMPDGSRYIEWWRAPGYGITTSVAEAHLFSKEELASLNLEEHFQSGRLVLIEAVHIRFRIEDYPMIVGMKKEKKNGRQKRKDYIDDGIYDGCS